MTIKLFLSGDATMGPYEIDYPGGSTEHWNEEPGRVWLQRITQHFDKVVWLNPQPVQHWQFYPSIHTIYNIMDKQMYPMTLDGIGQAIRSLG